MSMNCVLYQLCKSSLEIDLSLNKETISTSNEIFQATSVNEMIIRLGNYLIESKLTSMNILYFPNVTKLHLRFRGLIWNSSINLSKIMNLSQLVEIQLDCDYHDSNNVDLLCENIILLEKSSKLLTLIIRSVFRQRDIYPYLKRILRRIPSQIKYLQIPIKHIEQIQVIVQRCHQLRILQFPKKSVLISSQMREWFDVNTMGSIFRRGIQFDTIWIGKIQQQDHLDQKRIKLNHDDS